MENQTPDLISETSTGPAVKFFAVGNAGSALLTLLATPEYAAAQTAAINTDAVKTSAGALLIIPVCRTNSIYHTLKLLKNSGLKIAGASEKGAELIYKTDFSGPLALGFGCCSLFS